MDDDGNPVFEVSSAKLADADDSLGAGDDWMHHVLFRDWGDTESGGGDAGYRDGRLGLLGHRGVERPRHSEVLNGP